MKKIVVVFFVFALLSCGPKRMKCYGRRCVETTPLAQKTPVNCPPS